MDYRTNNRNLLLSGIQCRKEFGGGIIENGGG